MFLGLRQRDNREMETRHYVCYVDRWRPADYSFEDDQKNVAGLRSFSGERRVPFNFQWKLLQTHRLQLYYCLHENLIMGREQGKVIPCLTFFCRGLLWKTDGEAETKERMAMVA